jgi:peptidoglycan/xylan/chitin deacetylase (PgdA/CDA1 family)
MSAKSELVSRTAAALYRARLMPALSRAAGYVGGTAAFQILTYHRVNDEQDPFFPSLPTDVFERHMSYVAQAYSVMTVEHLVERLRHGRVPRNALALTFDDGYRDNLTHAAPILARHALPATIFLATGVIGTRQLLWFDRLALAFRETRSSSVDTPWGSTLALGTTAARLDALDRSLRRFKDLPEGEFERCLDTLLQALGGADAGGLKNVMLDWDDVHALTGLGFSIGAHSVTHPILSRVTPQRAHREIVDSRSRIQKACGAAPRAFAYPNGGPRDYTETVKRLVRDAGFTCAVTSRFGLNTRRTSAYELRRGGPWERDLPMFALRLAATRVIGA